MLLWLTLLILGEGGNGGPGPSPSPGLRSKRHHVVAAIVARAQS